MCIILTILQTNIQNLCQITLSQGIGQYFEIFFWLNFVYRAESDNLQIKKKNSKIPSRCGEIISFVKHA